MLNFSNFSPEKYLTEMAAASSSVASDDKGKLHELLLAKHLNSKRKLPLHHRSESDEYGGTPQQVHDRLKEKINPNAYKEINSHAKQTSEEVIRHINGIKDYKDHDISNIHWTSNKDTLKKAGDHEKTTGIKDVNANADLILTMRHKKTGKIKHIGISAKYGTEEQPNYRNDGLAALEKKGGLKAGTLSDIQKAHDQDMADRLGYTGTKAERHEQYKIGRISKGEERAAWKQKTGSNKEFKPKKKESLRARAAEDASVLARKKMARHLDAGLGNKTDDELRHFIRGQVSPPTQIYHVVAHSHVQDDGSAVSKVGDMSRIADKHLDNFQNLRVKKGTGIYTQIVGEYNGKERPVAQQILKTGSGPVKGSAGSFKLTSIPKKLQTAIEPAPKAQTTTAKIVKPKATTTAKPGKNYREHTDGTHGGLKF